MTGDALHISTRTGAVAVHAGSEFAVVGGVATRTEDGLVRIHRAHDASLIVVQCPAGTDVTIGTNSGRVECTGDLGRVHVATKSGAIRVEAAAMLDVRTNSGRVDIGRCDSCRITSSSSKVAVREARGATIAVVSGVVLLGGVERAEVKSVSGKVLVETRGAAQLGIKTVSGKVEVRVPRDQRPATRLVSVNGRVHCDCPPGSDGEISVKSVSGAIRVSSA